MDKYSAQEQFSNSCSHTDGVFMGISHINYRGRGVEMLLYNPPMQLNEEHWQSWLHPSKQYLIGQELRASKLACLVSLHPRQDYPTSRVNCTVLHSTVQPSILLLLQTFSGVYTAYQEEGE